MKLKAILISMAPSQALRIAQLCQVLTVSNVYKEHRILDLLVVFLLFLIMQALQKRSQAASVFNKLLVSSHPTNRPSTSLWLSGMCCRLCFIECVVHKDDCSKELLEWGSRVATANSRPPAP